MMKRFRAGAMLIYLSDVCVDCPPFCVLGNLPFNISLPLLFQWLDLISKKDGMFKLGRIPFVLTFQCEIAEVCRNLQYALSVHCVNVGSKRTRRPFLP